MSWQEAYRVRVLDLVLVLVLVRFRRGTLPAEEMVRLADT
jgi:hypothetical protein